ncbi:MAG: hypothetical protein EXX96DRAFT_491758 [Benjaminiella poitrasii]|nr:MAG: hypothetical protein EXX96DRAFT_491758 [Benjaminiella poitrasii]
MTGLREEDNSTVTALDYIERQEQLEKDAQDVLPGKFEKCTFPMGYIRQPLYACKTCTVDAIDEENKESLAGICYSCSIACHAEHDLFELFPKRHFRCDCGLPGKLNDHPCSLMLPAKRILKKNEENKYNHNFKGKYCRCDKYYDPEKEERTMYQIPEAIEDFEGYVCRSCTKKYPFLMNGKDHKFSYGLSKGNECIGIWILPESQIKQDTSSTSIPPTLTSPKHESTGVEQKREINSSADLSVKDNNKEDVASTDTTLIEKEEQNGLETSNNNPTQESITAGEKRKYEEEKDTIIPNTFKKMKREHDCSNVDITLLPEHDHIEIFMQENWRDGLCKCTKCLEDYKTNNVEFLLTEEKTYEPEEDEDAGRSLLEIGMEQLQRVDRIKAIESLMAYKSLATDIKSFLEAFKDTGRVVTKEDIEAFFAVKYKKFEEGLSLSPFYLPIL